jgi:hypothetical protein
MAYIPLQNAIAGLHSPGYHDSGIAYLKLCISGLDNAFYEIDWYKPYDRSGFIAENGWGAFLYQLTLRAPMILIGNTIAAPLNIITIMDKSFIEANWRKEPLQSITNFVKKGIFLNLYENIGSFIIVLFGALISPFKALIKASLNVRCWFGCSDKKPPTPHKKTTPLENVVTNKSNNNLNDASLTKPYSSTATIEPSPATNIPFKTQLANEPKPASSGRNQQSTSRHLNSNCGHPLLPHK